MRTPWALPFLFSRSRDARVRREWASAAAGWDRTRWIDPAKAVACRRVSGAVPFAPMGRSVIGWFLQRPTRVVRYRSPRLLFNPVGALTAARWRFCPGSTVSSIGEWRRRDETRREETRPDRAKTKRDATRRDAHCNPEHRTVVNNTKCGECPFHHTRPPAPCSSTIVAEALGVVRACVCVCVRACVRAVHRSVVAAAMRPSPGGFSFLLRRAQPTHRTRQRGERTSQCG
jgi:hypothetical protein